jgi:mono/diheme cytochrome c family protein
MSRRNALTALGLAALFGSSAALGACSKDDDPSARRDRVKNGAEIYSSMCASCHGPQGEGGRAPALRDLKTPEPELVAFVSERMPLGKAGTCTGDCAADVVAYILATFKGPLVCEAPKPVARGLRLLTRREYRNTVADLLGGTGSPSAPCGTTTFVYDPGATPRKSVHVAGSFNGWPQTVAGGGWPLAFGGGKWSLTRALPPGKSTYKLVLDDSQWIADPANPKTEPDGFGGVNSVVDVACSTGGAGGAADPTAAFPPDTRPEGFPFDDHGAGRVITSAHMDELFRAAASLARSADLSKIVRCDVKSGGEACLSELVSGFGARAFRRPLTTAERDRYAKLGRGQGDADKGARAVVQAMLASSSFLYRSEIGELQADGTYRLTPHEIASALSYSLWATTPDEELARAADSGELARPEGLERQARRLLASPRAREVIGVFAEQWLGAENVKSVEKSEQVYPGFDAPLRESMLAETRALAASAFFDTRRGADLFDASYTYVDERLAKHYGLPGVSGADLRKVNYPDGNRAGVLGHGSVLATTGHSDQTSPIRRGLFVRRRLLCQEFPPPPPNAGGVPKVDPGATTRERFAQHTQNPFCKSCHQYIDGVGFGFEAFDGVGRFRASEGGKPVDSVGDMNDVEGFGKGTHARFTSLAELGKTLAESDAAKACLVTQYYRFARGRLEDSACTVDAIKRRYLEKSGDPQEIILGVVLAPDFTVRR